MKKYILGALLLAMGCGGGTPNLSNQPEKSNYASTLEAATEITISEHSISMGRDYSILVGDEKVATVSGKDVRVVGGDVFTLKTLDGKVLAYEKEHKRWLSLSRAASIYDGQGNLVGYFGEEKIKDLFSVHYVFHIYDSNKREVGKSKKLTNSCLGKHDLLDAQGNVDYKIDKRFVMVGGDKYVITIVDPKSEISRWAAILLTCIEDAIGDSN